MKNLKKGFFAALFLSIAAAALWAIPLMTFSVVNNTTFDLGAVIIYNTNGVPSKVNVSGSGTFTLDIEGGVVSAVINNQPISKNGHGTRITLPLGPIVQVTMKGNQIVVQDQAIVSSTPKPHGK